MNCVSILMGLDAGTLKEKPTAKLEIVRLSKLAGEPFVVTLQAVSARRYTELVNNVTDKKGVVDSGKAYRAYVMVALAGLIDPPMKDKDIQEYYGCSTPEELLETIFTGGEITMIAEKITDLSGMSGNVVREVKN